MSYELDGWDYHAYQMKVDRAREKHATISEFGLTKQEIAKHEELYHKERYSHYERFAHFALLWITSKRITIFKSNRRKVS